MRATVCVHQYHKSFVRLIICRLCSMSFACILSMNLSVAKKKSSLQNGKFFGIFLFHLPFFLPSVARSVSSACVSEWIARRFPPVFSIEHTLITRRFSVHCSVFCSECLCWLYHDVEHHVIIVQWLVALPSRLAINYNATHCHKLHLFFCSNTFFPSQSIEWKIKYAQTRHCSICNHLDDSFHVIYSFTLCQSTQAADKRNSKTTNSFDTWTLRFCK